MKIIFLGLAIPNMDIYHNMFSELVKEFHRKGHEVLIIAPAHQESGIGLQKEDGIDILRVPTLKLFNVGILQKGLATILLPYQFKRALKESGVDLNFDLIFMPTPPITLSTVASWLKRKSRAKVYLILRDIFPQNAVDLKMMSNKSIPYSYFRRKERHMYKVSDHIGCMSQGNIDFVMKHNPEVERRKFQLLPNWGILRPLLSKEEVQAIKKDYGLENKFVVMFGGNIGRPQKLENVIALAEACVDKEDIFFMIIGGGNEKNHISDLIRKKSLNNIKILEYLSRDDFFNVLQIAEVGLISLSEEFTIPNIPSKSVVYFNAKIPILASIDKNTDFGRNLENINAGFWIEAGQTKQFKDKLLMLYKDKELRKTMGENGYNYMKNELLVEKAYNSVLKHIN